MQKNNPYDFGRMGILLIIFSGELVSNWYPVSIFEEPKSPKSLVVQGFLGLVICQGFHCWEEQNVADGGGVG